MFHFLARSFLFVVDVLIIAWLALAFLFGFSETGECIDSYVRLSFSEFCRLDGFAITVTWFALLIFIPIHFWALFKNKTWAIVVGLSGVGLFILEILREIVMGR